MPRKPDPELIDEDAPEAGADWFKKARQAADVLPELLGTKTATELLAPRRGRPRSASVKEHLNIRLDPDVVEAFRSTGTGWQTRINDALRDWLKRHHPGLPGPQ